MLDIKFIKEHPDLIKENIKKKFQQEKLPLVDKVIKNYDSWLKLKQEAEVLRHKRNLISEKINALTKHKKDISSELKQVKQIPEKIKKIEEKQEKINQEIKKDLLQIPNIIHHSVPIGKDASQNKVIKIGSKINKFDFPVKNHVELAEKLDIADFEASARVSGRGFYYLKKNLALLNQALIRFTIDFMRKKKYEYIETPLMLNEESIYASMDKKTIEESVYSIKGEDLNLIGTAEQSLLAMHSGDTIPESELPKKYFSYSMCFRKEIGSHGINEKGLWRTHQFNKVEQFIFCRPEDSEKYYNELLKNSEEILKELELPYRIIEICSGDLSDWKYRSADLEVYRPTTKEYGEVMSLSNCTDYQARKLNIKYIDEKGNKRILSTLNDTAMATSRIMVAIIENNQQKDGSIKVPKALQKFMGGVKVIK